MEPMNDYAIDSVDPAHHVQRQILMDLRQHGNRAYQQLKPAGLEGNAYNYHLKILRHAGLINLADSEYALTPLGSLVTDAFSQEKQRLLVRPHYYVYPLIYQGSNILIYQPKRRPGMGKLVLPSGKLHVGESIAVCLRREAKRRNLEINPLQWSPVCTINVRYVNGQGAVVAHRPGVMFSVSYNGPLETAVTDSGESFWVNIADIKNDACTPDVMAAVKILQGENVPVVDQDYVIG